MAYTETTRTSYGQRLKGSIGGIFLGFLMVIAGTIVLWWNEGRTVKTRDMLKDAEKNYVEMENPATINPELNGKLVHAKAFATTTDSLVDPSFRMGAVAVKLNASAEYYQWTEQSKSQSKDKIGGGKETVTTYTYSKGWTYAPVESQNFHDPDYQGVNFVNYQVGETGAKAENVSFGAYRLNQKQISSFNNPKPMDVVLDKELAESINRVCADRRKDVADTNTTGLKYVHTDGNVLYIGRNPNVPEIGDVRITFTKDMPSNVSILAKVDGDTFTDYKAKNDKMFSALSMGEVSAEEMFSSEHSSNNLFKWLLRLGGALLVIMGIKSMFSIIPTLLKILPFLGSIADAGVGLVAFILGLAWSLFVIAIAWLRYHPLYGIVLLVLSGALIFFLVKKGRDKKKAQQPISS